MYGERRIRSLIDKKEPKLELTPEQKQLVIDFWNLDSSNPPAIKDITRHVFGKELDTRHPEGGAIVRFLATQGKKVAKSTDKVELTEEQKSYVENNSSNMTAVDMARILFNNPKITNLNAETLVVNKYLKDLIANKGKKVIQDVEDVPDEEYRPPSTQLQALKKVNRYTSNNWTLENANSQLKKGLDALVKYLNNDHVVRQINVYDSQEDRQSFEDAFVRYTYNKPDLTQEEVDQYCVLANEIVLSFKAQHRSERLQRMLDELTDNEPESARISMSLVEAISKATNEHNQCVNRQQKLLDDLTEKRSDRLSKNIKENASVLNLLEAWSNEESRKSWLHLADIESKAVKDEINKMISMEEIRGRIIGLTESEAMWG